MKRSLLILSLAVLLTGACSTKDGKVAVQDKGGNGATAQPSVSRPDVDFRVASQTEKEGYRKAAYDGDKSLYLSPEVFFKAADLADVEAKLADGGIVVDLTFRSSDKKAKLRGTSMDKPLMLGVELSGSLIKHCKAWKGERSNIIRLGGMLPGDASGIARLLKGRMCLPDEAYMFFIPKATRIAPGERVDIDVYVTGAYDIRGFQVATDVAGGARGALALKEAAVDENRPDYIFASMATVTTSDKADMMAAPFEGSADATGPAYLGTYTYEASAEAKGAFQVSFMEDTERTMLRDSMIELIPCKLGPAVSITVSK